MVLRYKRTIRYGVLVFLVGVTNSVRNPMLKTATCHDVRYDWHRSPCATPNQAKSIQYYRNTRYRRQQPEREAKKNMVIVS